MWNQKVERHSESDESNSEEDRPVYVDEDLEDMGDDIISVDDSCELPDPIPQIDGQGKIL